MKSLKFVEDFLRDVEGRPPVKGVTAFGEIGLLISRAKKGTLLFSRDEGRAYQATLTRLETEFAAPAARSRRSFELLLQEAIMSALDPAGRSSKSFDDRVAAAVSELRRALVAPASTYRCFIPIQGFGLADLPFVFGGVRFTAFRDSHLSQIAKGHRQNRRTIVQTAKQSPLWTEACAILDVPAHDEKAAAIVGTENVRNTLDALNFMKDLIPYNHAWVYLPGEAESASQASVIVDRATGAVSLPHDAVGPLGPFSLQNARKDREVWKLITVLSRLLRTVEPKTGASLLLSSIRWAGRACVERRREQGFLLLAIALEAVVLPRHEQELTYRLALRVARLLGANREHRAEIRKSIKRLYAVRSRIVHAGSYEVTDEDYIRMKSLTISTLLELLRRRKFWRLPESRVEDWFEELGE